MRLPMVARPRSLMVVIVGGLVAAALIVLVIVIAPWLLTRYPHHGLTADQALNAKNDVRTTLVQALAGIAVAGGLVVTYRNYQLSKSQQVTEIYTKAVEQLGHDQAPVRLGALYSLEHLGQDNPVRRETVVDVLCAYLRMPYAPPAEAHPDNAPAAAAAVPEARHDPATGAAGTQDRPADSRRPRAPPAPSRRRSQHAPLPRSSPSGPASVSISPAPPSSTSISVTRWWRPTSAGRRSPAVYAARFTHLTNRQDNRLTVTQARAVIAAAILRQLHAVITTGQRWDPVIATHGAKHSVVVPIAA
jgi:hypothetical protein